MSKLLRGRDAGRTTIAQLYARAVEKSREPRLYAVLGAPDTVEGRFELLTTYVLLVIERLNREGDRGRTVSQSLFDLYVRNLDSALREMGVSDLAVGKRMKGLAKVFYGRAAAYAAAFDAGDNADLEALVARTILVGRPSSTSSALARHLAAERRLLAGTDFDHLLSGGSW